MTGRTPPVRRGLQAYTRKEADELFSRVMEIEGVPAWRRQSAYLAVRAFGRWAWRTT